MLLFLAVAAKKKKPCSMYQGECMCVYVCARVERESRIVKAYTQRDTHALGQSLTKANSVVDRSRVECKHDVE